MSSASSVPVSSKFSTLPARPPTPPRDISNAAVDDAIKFLDDSNDIEQHLKQSRSNNLRPDGSLIHSPAPSRAAPGEANASKKVDFSPHLKYHKLSSTESRICSGAYSPKLGLSAQHIKPLRSILKLSSIPPPLTPDDLETKLGYFSPEAPVGFARMLQSVIQQLAGSTLSSRLDAYLTLNGSLKAYEDVPDPQAMVAKMSLLTQFITRDMPWRQTGNPIDTKLVDQVLKLTLVILYDSRLSAALDDDFRAFLFDRSVAVLEQTGMPKSIVKAHMFLLAQHRFKNSIMTTGKADKLVTVLSTIEARCSGNGVVGTRLVIYQRLLEKAPAVMAYRFRDFFEHVFHGMLSSHKDIRSRAIETCTLAGMLMGTQSQISKALDDMLDSEAEDGQTYFIYLTLRLIGMISDKELGPYVPQIWSSIILYFRSKGRPLEKWSKMKNWLSVLQKCLNASDLDTKYQAHLAWNKLVFTVLPGASTTPNMFSMLMVPITAGMEKKGSDKHSKQARQFAWDSYYNLLHYSFRPGTTHSELDSAWDRYVEPALSISLKSGSRGRHSACRVLDGLFARSSGVWNMNAATEIAPIKPNDLPKLDPRWVRSRLSRPLKLMEDLLLNTMWLPKEATSIVDHSLGGLIDSVTEAGGQEVKISNELRDAVASMVDMLRRLWHSDAKQPAEADDGAWFNRYDSVVRTMVKGIGAPPFTEDILTVTKDDTVEAATTPSHRPSKHQGAPQAALVILFGLLYQPRNGSIINTPFFELARHLLDLLVSCRTSMPSKVELINRSLLTWSSSSSNSDSRLAGRLWTCVADCAAHLLDIPETQSHGSQQIGHGLRGAASILSVGIKYTSGDAAAMASMTGLYLAMSQSATKAAGTGGQVLAVIEPVAKALLSETNPENQRARLALASQMLRATCWPRSRSEMDHARKAIWGVTLAPHKAVAFDPYEHLYLLVVDLMVSAYGTLESIDDVTLEPLLDFVASCMVFLRTCPPSILAIALRKMQNGFVTWIEDKQRRTAASGLITEALLTSWREIVRLLHTLPQQDTTLLKALEPLLVAGLICPHRAVVNTTIAFWNDTFGHQTTLEYPAKIEVVLRARLAETDLTLPDFPDSGPQDDAVRLPQFYDSQLMEQSSIPRISLTGEASRISATAPSVRGAQLSVPALRLASVSSPVSNTSRLSGSSTPRAKLRHDDSQIQFAPIDSSPVRLDDESQHLTEHQRDVRDRQLQLGQMFPDLSSSPMLQQRGPVQKRLNFATTNELARPVAVMQLQHIPALDLPMSDDLPSSPTPSSARTSTRSQVNLNDLGADEEDMDDPPSSPPAALDNDDLIVQQTELDADAIDATTIVSTNSIAHARGGDDDDPKLDDDGNVPDATQHAVGADHVDFTSDLPSDTLLPEAQLRDDEEKAAEALAQQPVRTNDSVENGDNPNAPPSSQDPMEVEAVIPIAPQTEDEITRVEDSFVEARSPQQTDKGSIDDNQQSQRGSGRKRKRPSSVVYSSKKRKQQSPFKRFISGIIGRSQEEAEDDEIGDEIVVASSQVPTSPLHEVGDDFTAREPEHHGMLLEAMPEPTVAEAAAPELPLDSTVKRGRGRPRKSETPTPTSEPGVHATRSLKRRASALSNTSDVSLEPRTHVVKSTPGPAKARKQRGAPDAKLARDASMSQESSATPRRSRRALSAVVIPNTRGSALTDDDDIESRMGSDNGRLSPGSQLKEEAAAVLSEQPVTTPKSFIGHLRGLLSALPSMVLGPREEREADDLLFEIKKEVHEAGRRGRADK